MDGFWTRPTRERGVLMRLAVEARTRQDGIKFSEIREAPGEVEREGIECVGIGSDGE